MSSRQRPCALLFGTKRLSGVSGQGLFSDYSPIGLHVAALKRAGCDQVALVGSTGSSSAASRLKDVRVVLHSGAWDSPFDEIVLGLFALERSPVLILPVDHQIISDHTLALLMAEAENGAASHAIVPFHGQRSGYPIVLFRTGIEAVIREAGKPSGLRRFDAVLQSWKEGVRVLSVADDTVAGEFVARA